MLVNICSATTINVPADYSTIQEGLGAATGGDTVLVASGTYHETLIWPYINGIVLTSSGDSSNTIIDAQQLGSVITFDGDSTTLDTMTIVSNFTIRNGLADLGGGIFCDNASPKLTSILIEDNVASGEYWLGGGGMYCSSSSPILRDMTITGNYSNQGGGGLCCSESSSPQLNNVIITNNIAETHGGGIYCNDSALLLTDVSVNDNRADVNGGGICSVNESSINSNNISIYGNSANDCGGGIYFWYSSSSTITDSDISLNTANQDGGGIFCRYYSDPIFINTLINANAASNMGGAFYAKDMSDPRLENCTISYNSSSAIYTETGSRLSIVQSNILSHNGFALFNEDGTVAIDAGSCWWGDSTGPFHTIENQEGLGDSVNQYVNVSPWLTEADIVAPVVPVQDLKVDVEDREFTLTWRTSTLTDLAGYRVYFDTDVLEPPFPQYYNEGLDTTCQFAGLNEETEYYTAVTCIDTDGNESSPVFQKVITGLGTFALLEPENNSICFNRIFKWRKSPSADPEDTVSYFVEWSEDESFTNINIETVCDTFVYLDDIPNNQNVFWRVRSSGLYENEGFCEDYSSGWNCFMNASEKVFKTNLESVAYTGFSMYSDDSLYVPTRFRVFGMDTNGNINSVFGALGDIIAPLAIASDQTVYVVSISDSLYSYDSNGNINPGWPISVHNPITSPAAIDSSGIIYLGAGNCMILAIDPIGEILWDRELVRAIRSAPIISSDNFLYVINVQGSMFALDLENLHSGHRWQLNMNHGVVSSPALDIYGNIYVTTQDGLLIKVVNNNGFMGFIDWSFDTNLGECSSPIIDANGIVYFAETSGKIFAVDSQNGNLVWESELNSLATINCTPVLSPDGLIYVGDSEGYIHSISSIDGEIIWSHRNEGSIEGALLYNNNCIYYCAGQYAISLHEPLIPPECVTNSCLDEEGWWPTFQGNNRRTGYQRDNATVIEDKKEDLIPAEFKIESIYPNPFNPSLNIKVSLPEKAELKLSVYNVLGQEVARIADHSFNAGNHNFVFNGSDLSSGVYFVNACVGGKLNQVQKVILMK